MPPRGRRRSTFPARLPRGGRARRPDGRCRSTRPRHCPRAARPARSCAGRPARGSPAPRARSRSAR
ncbi:MAG: hypothetical protein DMD96_09125 [Candidatus Rokuibacteriota bacterium]|nr:MAG: hypothetical protein DMD96_09125 [Candidatus Rokubacteria bacterium]